MSRKGEEHGALVKRFLIDVIGDGDLDATDVFIADGMQMHDLNSGELSWLDEASAHGRGVLAAADIDVTIEETVAEGNIVAVRSTLSGTMRGLPVDAHLMGNSFEIAHVGFYRIEDGQIAELWSLADGLGLVKQLGLPPSSVHSPENSADETTTSRE